MKHLDGRKIGGEHTTFIEMASDIANMLLKLPGVDKISPGYINAGIGTGRGTRSVKIIDAVGCVLDLLLNNFLSKTRSFAKTLLKIYPLNLG
ncbi:MAG: DUF2103 domain-containing protein [Patescibacteria group bacterium]